MTSLNSFVNWAVARGRVGNPNGTYAGQCVSLVQQYLNQCYGIPYRARGNARSFVPPYFYRVSGAPQPGDIVQYGRNYGGGYGHIGLIGADGRFVDQNGTRRLHVAVRNTPFRGYVQLWRPNRRCALYDAAPAPTPAPAPAPAPSLGVGSFVAQHGTFRASTNMKIRRAPSLTGEVVGTFTAGSTQRYDGYIDANCYRWISWVGASGHRNYVARRNFKNGQIYGQCY